MNISRLIKKHQKTLMIGGGALAVLYLMQKSKPKAAVMPIGPTVEQLKAVSGPLGSLE